MTTRGRLEAAGNFKIHSSQSEKTPFLAGSQSLGTNPPTGSGVSSNWLHYQHFLCDFFWGEGVVLVFFEIRTYSVALVGLELEI